MRCRIHNDDEIVDRSTSKNKTVLAQQVGGHGKLRSENVTDVCQVIAACHPLGVLEKVEHSRMHQSEIVLTVDSQQGRGNIWP